MCLHFGSYRTGRGCQPRSDELRGGVRGRRSARGRRPADRGEPHRAGGRRGARMNLPFASPADAVRTVPGTPDPLLGALAKVQSIERVGRVAEAHGPLIRATGLKAGIGELCVLRNPPGEGAPNFRLSAEVELGRESWREKVC